MSSDFVVAIELLGNNCVKNWRQVIGPTNSLVAKQDAPNSVRGLYGTDNTRNAVHGSDSN